MKTIRFIVFVLFSEVALYASLPVYYVVSPNGEISITHREVKEKSKNLIFKNPIFNRDEYLKIQLEEQKAMLKRSKIIDKGSVFDLGLLTISVKAGKPRVNFSKLFDKKKENQKRIVPAESFSTLNEKILELDW